MRRCVPVRGAYGTPEAGTRTQYVQYVAPLEASRPAPLVRTQRGRLRRPGRTCQLRWRLPRTALVDLDDTEERLVEEAGVDVVVVGHALSRPTVHEDHRRARGIAPLPIPERDAITDVDAASLGLTDRHDRAASVAAHSDDCGNET